MLTTMAGIHCFIQGAGVISPQKTHDNREFLPEVTHHDSHVLTCIPPDFKQYFSPMQLRRLGRMPRMVLAAAAICLDNARVSTVDAIITATGYGAQEDMAKFLDEMLDQDEKLMPPTYFMQSGYNAMAGLLAMYLACTGYNNNFVSRGFAFETALHDAVLHLREKKADRVLLGAFDDVSPQQYGEYIRMGYFKEEKIDHLSLFESKTAGTLQGEGVAFFILSAVKTPESLCRIRDFRMVYRPADDGVLSRELNDFLKANHVTTGDIDIVVNGVSGDADRDQWNLSLRRDRFAHAAEVRFKHLTGEYATASSFALWLGAEILKKQTIPQAVLATPIPTGCPLGTALVCNHFLGRNYSFFLLTSR